jgi:hypothetical protein
MEVVDRGRQAPFVTVEFLICPSKEHGIHEQAVGAKVAIFYRHFVNVGSDIR